MRENFALFGVLHDALNVVCSFHIAPIDGTKTIFSFNLARSYKSTDFAQQTRVCILTRVTATASGDLDSFSVTSDSSDFTLTPIARFYGAQSDGWENVAGPYSQTAKIRCSWSNRCKLNVPLMPDIPPGKFVLMSFEHSLKNFDETLSRFFTQTTFGPTKSMISDWSYSNDTEGMAQWTKDQMNSAVTPLTSHRAYFRERADWSMKSESSGPGAYVPQHPCNKYSRWRDYAFTGDDYGKAFTVSELESGKLLIVVDNEPRTVVASFTDTYDPVLYDGPGTYSFCE